MVDGSDTPFRLLCLRHGVGIAYTPMYNVGCMATKRETLQTLCAELRAWKEACRPLAVQLSGRDPSLFRQVYEELPHDCFDVIDINMGCSQAIAARGKYGAYLIDEPETARKIVTALAAVATHPIGVKTRISEDAEKTFRFLSPLVQAGARIVTLHGRQRSQRTGYNVGPPSWATIRDVFHKLRAAHPDKKLVLIANGGVWCAEAHLECLRITGADATMAGTYLLQDPTLYEGCGVALRSTGNQSTHESTTSPPTGSSTGSSTEPRESSLQALPFSYELSPSSQLISVAYSQHPAAFRISPTQPAWPAKWENIMRTGLSQKEDRLICRLTDDIPTRRKRIQLALEFLRICKACSRSPAMQKAALSAVLPHLMNLCGPDLFRANTDLRTLLVRAKDDYKRLRAGGQYISDCRVVITELMRRLDEGLGFTSVDQTGSEEVTAAWET